MLSTRNSEQNQQQQQKHQQSQQDRSAKLIEPKPVTQLPIQTITQQTSSPLPQIAKLPAIVPTISPIQFIFSKSVQSIPSIPIQLQHERLQTAQSQNSYQQQSLPLHMQITPKHTKTLQDLINITNTPLQRRRRRKSRRQRKVRNHLEESSNFWPDRLMSKGSTYPIIETETYETDTYGNANDDIAYAISLSENNKVNFNHNNISSNSNRLNQFNVETKNYKIWNPIKAESVLEAPFATSTSAGKTQMIIISSSRIISTSTDRNGNGGKHSDTKHRKDTVNPRSHQFHKNNSTAAISQHIDHGHNAWKNKYNIDYDNKLEDEYEIIMKDE